MCIRDRCGYPGCRPYAEAVGLQGEKINRCAPGGEAVMLKIAEMLNVEPQPIDGDVVVPEPVRMLAIIDEANCIGCTKCIQLRPVETPTASWKWDLQAIPVRIIPVEQHA